MTRADLGGGFAVDLYGYGRVARALLPMLARHGIGLATVSDRSGVRLRQEPAEERRVVVDATSPSYEGKEAEAWTAHLEEVLSQGTPVVTCNKAPLAIAWTRLRRAARRGHTTVSCAATVGGGTPVLFLLQRLQRSHRIDRVEAALSATVGYVCSLIAAGASIPGAIRRAQLAGWAEPDPWLDLDGSDSYAKAVITHNLLFSDDRPLRLNGDRPRLCLDEELIRRRSREGKTSRLVSTIRPGSIELDLVSHSNVDSAQGTAGFVIVEAILHNGLKVSIAGPGAGPGLTAGALLGDLRDLLASRQERPWGVIP